MSDYLPIVVAAPGSARERLRRSDVLPHHLFRDIAAEQLWEEHSAPSVYLWPYDIPYSHSDELREKILERVGDVPAFFGMSSKEAKDHQERMLSRILFGSVVVHILFLDNRKTDTTPGYEERNETYAQFCTFSEIVQWSRNLKQVMDVRFLNNNSKSHHILILVSCGQQVVTTKEEIDELNKLIGPSNSRDYKPFRSCYFLDLNLVPGASGKIFHSKYIWDVLISRFLLALLLSQEKNNNALKPLWEKNPGIKVWRASDCTISVQRDTSQAILKKILEKVAKELQNQLVSKDGDMGERLALLQDVSDDSNSLDHKLVPHWSGNMPEFQKWTGKQNAKWSFSMLSSSFFCNWSDLQASEYEQEIETPEQWRESFEQLKQVRTSWCAAHPPADYTSAVENFFSIVHKKPGELGSFISQLFGKMDSTYKKQLADKENHPKYWEKIVAVEKSRQQLLKRLAEDCKEFKKAQNYYVGRGIAMLVLVAVTAFSCWIIWRVLGLFGEFLKIFPWILLLSGMVFAGGAVAYVLVMLLHNFTGTRAAGKIMAECKEADEKMQQRDDLVREMFFDGIKKRNILNLQCVRFRTWLLANRTLSILQTEMQPQLSTLLEVQDDSVQDRKSAELLADPDHVRDAYLKLTRSSVGPIRIEKADDELQELKEMISGSGDDSFLSLWKKICTEDRMNAGYFPAKMFVSRIRGFVTSFLENIHRGLFEESIQKSKEKLKDGLDQYIQKVDTIDSESLLSASLPSYAGQQTKLLFVNSSFKDFLPDGETNIAIDGRYSSKLLETTRTAALFYQEFDVDFDLKPIPGSEATDSGQLTFKVKIGEA